MCPQGVKRGGGGLSVDYHDTNLRFESLPIQAPSKSCSRYMLCESAIGKRVDPGGP